MTRRLPPPWRAEKSGSIAGEASGTATGEGPVPHDNSAPSVRTLSRTLSGNIREPEPGW
jgi:hypothetical protein